MVGCQYIGPEQDPHKGPLRYCGAKTIEGRSYCHEHYYVVYKKGTSVNGRKKEKEIEKEIAELKRAQELEMDYD